MITFTLSTWWPTWISTWTFCHQWCWWDLHGILIYLLIINNYFEKILLFFISITLLKWILKHDQPIRPQSSCIICWHPMWCRGTCIRMLNASHASHVFLSFNLFVLLLLFLLLLFYKTCHRGLPLLRGWLHNHSFIFWFDTVSKICHVFLIFAIVLVILVVLCILSKKNVPLLLLIRQVPSEGKCKWGKVCLLSNPVARLLKPKWLQTIYVMSC